MRARAAVGLVAVVLAGCAPSPSAEVLKALAGDPNSICFSITTPWGGTSLDRNHGCASNPGTPIVVVSGGGPGPIKVERLAP